MKNSPILNDYVFKQVFGQKDDNPILISFLNAMLDGDIKVKHVEIKNPEMVRFCEMGRTILLDVQVQTDDGTYIDIEVQNGYKSDLIDRMFVYGAGMVHRYSEKATRFDKTHCIAIWILNCNMKEFKKFGNEPIIGEFNFRSLKRPEKYIALEGLKIYPIELRKGLGILDLSPEKQTWINFLIDSTNNISKPVELEEIHEAYEKVQYTTESEAYRSYIDAIKRTDQLYAGDMEMAKQEALQKGIKEGIKEGLEKGKEEGKLEKMRELALNMKSQGFDNEMITKCLNIDVKELINLLGN